MDDASPARTIRGPNAVRRAATRAKIMDAAVRCLAEFGYAATSTPLVAKLAGVSRGSLLHQFPTKVDLILAVAQHAGSAQGAFIRDQIMRKPAGRERFVEGVDAVWASMQRPEAVALTEIRLAARSDPELAERYPEYMQAVAQGRHRARERMAEGIGAPQRAEEVEVLAELTLAALRGLAMESIFIGQEKPQAEKVIALLKTLRGRLVDDLAS